MAAVYLEARAERQSQANEIWNGFAMKLYKFQNILLFFINEKLFNFVCDGFIVILSIFGFSQLPQLRFKELANL